MDLAEKDQGDRGRDGAGHGDHAVNGAVVLQTKTAADEVGNEIDLIAYFVSRGFGLKHYSTIYSMIAMAGAVSTAIALVLFPRVHDVTGSYDIALMIGTVGFCTGAFAFAAIIRAR